MVYTTPPLLAIGWDKARLAPLSLTWEGSGEQGAKTTVTSMYEAVRAPSLRAAGECQCIVEYYTEEGGFRRRNLCARVRTLLGESDPDNTRAVNRGGGGEIPVKDKDGEVRRKDQGEGERKEQGGDKGGWREKSESKEGERGGGGTTPIEREKNKN